MKPHAPLAETDPTANDSATRAADWLSYLYSGEASDAGRAEFGEWLRDDANRQAYRRLETWWRNLDHFAAEGERFLPSERAGASAPQPASGEPGADDEDAAVPRRAGLAPMAALAATLAGVAILGSTLWIRWPHPDPAVVAHYANPTGNPRTIALPDGSSVTLGSRSAITTRLSPKERKIDLEAGQAYFAVAHIPGRPFTVAAAGVTVEDIGTEFEVSNDPGRVRVSVAQGAVAVGNSLSRPPSRRLQEGQQIDASPSGTLGEVRRIDRKTAFAWREGRLMLLNVALADALLEVNRYRGTPIVLADPTLGEMRITMGLPTNETDRLLEGLRTTGKVRIEHRADRVIIGRDLARAEKF